MVDELTYMIVRVVLQKLRHVCKPDPEWGAAARAIMSENDPTMVPLKDMNSNENGNAHA